MAAGIPSPPAESFAVFTECSEIRSSRGVGSTNVLVSVKATAWFRGDSMLVRIHECI